MACARGLTGTVATARGADTGGAADHVTVAWPRGWGGRRRETVVDLFQIIVLVVTEVQGSYLAGGRGAARVEGCRRR